MKKTRLQLLDPFMSDSEVQLVKQFYLEKKRREVKKENQNLDLNKGNFTEFSFSTPEQNNIDHEGSQEEIDNQPKNKFKELQQIKNLSQIQQLNIPFSLLSSVENTAEKQNIDQDQQLINAQFPLVFARDFEVYVKKKVGEKRSLDGKDNQKKVKSQKLVKENISKSSKIPLKSGKIIQHQQVQNQISRPFVKKCQNQPNQKAIKKGAESILQNSFKKSSYYSQVLKDAKKDTYKQKIYSPKANRGGVTQIEQKLVRSITPFQLKMTEIINTKEKELKGIKDLGIVKKHKSKFENRDKNSL